jgi:hypothetical protein
MTHLPSQTENPKGLHARYAIQKIVKNPKCQVEVTDTFMGIDDTPEFVTVPVDPGAEYFVMRLDMGGSDKNHIMACRIAIKAYAEAMADLMPELSKDLLERYPVLLLGDAKINYPNSIS